MQSTLKTREINSEICECAVYGILSRFLVNVNYYAEANIVSSEIEKKANRVGINVRVEKFCDGSASVYMQKLLPWDTDEDELEDETDKMLTAFESAVNLTEEDESSMGWCFGHLSTDYDSLMTAEEQSVVN